MLDLLVKGGTLIDGSGEASRTADVGVQAGEIVAVGRIAEPARRTIDADGLIVTPGFVDIHTHYDGQALWDDKLDPSFSNGVTTAVFGNCGVGFAPVRDGMQDDLIDLMDGVEEIPGSVLSEGLAWDWNSFPEYLDRLDNKARAINVATLVTHGPLRLYVMGDKVRSRTSASDAELAEMACLLDEALVAGAWGLSTSRTPVHVAASGLMTPDFDVEFRELRALAEVTGRHGAAFEVVPFGSVGEGLDSLRRDMAFFERIALETNTAVHLLVSQTDEYPEFWREQLAAMERVAARGKRMYGQVNGRGIGLMLGMLNTNPFETRATYLDVMTRPSEERLAAFRDPSVRERILAEPDHFDARRAFVSTILDYAYAFQGLDYEPPADRKVSAIAAQTGRTREAAAYDLMVEDGFLFAPMLNYHDGDLSATHAMISNPNCLLAASDAGAHSLTVCDGALPTFMLSYWARDRTRGERIAVEEVVRLMTSKPADAIGLHGRGRIAPGQAADINVIDMAALQMEEPKLVTDLPAGGTRLLQGARGYRATIVSGVVTRENDRDSGERMGRLLRRPQQ